jgi:hypothetical protein
LNEKGEGVASEPLVVHTKGTHRSLRRPNIWI